MGKRVERLKERRAMKRARIKKVLGDALLTLVVVLVWGAVMGGVIWVMERIIG